MAYSENLVWMDLEMTGLDPEVERILEIATIITDSSLNVIAEVIVGCHGCVEYVSSYGLGSG
jgi:oligoribonuclease (3'-5' exoribonuclease)